MAPYDLASAYLSNLISYDSSASTLHLQLAHLLFFKYVMHVFNLTPFVCPSLHLQCSLFI